MSRRSTSSAAALALMATIVACSPGPEERERDPSPTAQRTIATVGDRTITAAEVEAYVGQQGLAEQLDPELPPAERYAEVARRMVVDERLYQAALDGDADQDPTATALGRNQQRLLYTHHYLSTLPLVEPISEERLRERFAAAKARLDRPETRRVSHIFLRWTDPQNRQPVLDRLAAIRRQALDGRPFALLAREHSQSETRHRDGLVGFVERGVFPADFDRVVFDLEPEVPSEVLATADGAHLIYVHNVLEARDVAFEDVRDLLRRELLVEQRFERLRQAAAAVPTPEDLWMVDRDRLPGLMRSAPDEQPLLRVGEIQVTAGELRQQLLPLGQQLGDLADEELPADLLQELRNREILFQHLLAREQAGEDLELPDEQIAAAQRRQLIQHEAQRRMTERLAADSELLEGFRSENALRFSTPLRFVIERLTVPAEPAGMARLEAAREGLDAGTLTLQDLATELGGEVGSTGWVSLGQLAAGDRRAVQFAPLLRPGEHSPPYVAGPVMTLFAVRDRVEPEALPLAAVRQPVIDAYLEQHGRRLFRELTDELLAEAGFTLAASP